MDLEYITNKLKSIIINKDILKDKSELCNNESLKNKGLDSIDLINLIVLIEDEFSFAFDIDELVIENFDSINDIANIIKCKLLR